jgi:hypothetical protein
MVLQSIWFEPITFFLRVLTIAIWTLFGQHTMTYETHTTDKKRCQRATTLRALQELREDYDLLRLDAILRRIEVSDSVNAHLAGRADRSFQIQRALSTISYYCELIYALNFNIKVVSRRAAAVERSQGQKG